MHHKSCLALHSASQLACKPSLYMLLSMPRCGTFRAQLVQTSAVVHSGPNLCKHLLWYIQGPTCANICWVCCWGYTTRAVATTRPPASPPVDIAAMIMKLMNSHIAPLCYKHPSWHPTLSRPTWWQLPVPVPVMWVFSPLPCPTPTHTCLPHHTSDSTEGFKLGWGAFTQ
jgi:hypothetical protein